MAAACHRANEYTGIRKVLVQPCAIAEDRAVRKRRTRIDRDDADRFAGGAHDLHERRRQRRLTDAGRARDADRGRATAAWEKRVHQFRTLARFGAADRARESARIARLEQRQDLAIALVHLATSAATRGRSRRAIAIPRRAPIVASVANAASAAKAIDHRLGPAGGVSAPKVKSQRISAHNAEPLATNVDRATSASTASSARCGASLKT